MSESVYTETFPCFYVLSVFMCVCTCLCSKMLNPLMSLVYGLKQTVSTVEKMVESGYGSPNVPVCMQINFALNTKSERQVVPVYVSLSLQQKLHPLSRD